MRIATGKVVGGQILVEGDALAEGTRVTILCTDEREFELNPAEEAELLEAMAEADRGDVVDAGDLLAKLRR